MQKMIELFRLPCCPEFLPQMTGMAPPAVVCKNVYCTSSTIFKMNRNGAWSIGSVRASGAVGPEFEPTFCHSLLSGGPWQDLVSSVRLEPLTSIRCVCGTKEWSQQPRRSVESTSEETQKGSSGAQQRSPGIHPKCRHLQKTLFPPKR